jgi:hypothetical protein
MHKRLSLEIGRQERMIVMDDADLDPGARGGALGRIRHHRAAVHRHQPPDSSTARSTTASCAAWWMPPKAFARGRSVRKDRRGAADSRRVRATRSSAYVEIGRDEGAELGHRRQGPRGTPGRRLVLPTRPSSPA